MCTVSCYLLEKSSELLQDRVRDHLGSDCNDDTEGEKPEAPPPDVAAPPEGETPKELPPPEPFTLKADGRDIPLDGAVLTAGDNGVPYVVMPLSTMQRQLQPHIADRDAWQREREQLQTQRSENELKADTLVEHFDKLMQADEDGAALWAWLQDFKANKETLAKDLEIAVLKKGAATRQVSDERSDREASDDAYQKWAPGALEDTVKGILKLEEFEGLGLEAEDLYNELEALGGQTLFFTATEDEQRWGRSFEKGRTYPHYGNVFTVINGHAKVARRFKKNQGEAAAAKEANEVALGGGDGGKPVVTASESPVLGGKTPKAPTTLSEWEESLEGDD